METAKKAIHIAIEKNEDEAITGAELEQMTDEELEKNVRKYSVYARVSPEHKVRIVKAWQKNGEIGLPVVAPTDHMLLSNIRGISLILGRFLHKESPQTVIGMSAMSGFHDF